MAYPTIMFGILPVTLISYDERFHWPAYAGTLPLRRRDEVREKYLLSAAADRRHGNPYDRIAGDRGFAQRFGARGKGL